MESGLLDQVKAVVSRLAAPAAEQIEYLRSIETYPGADELALEFHDLVISPSRLRTNCVISDEALRLIAALDEKLNRFSGEIYSSEWDASALESSQNWSDVRTLAKQVLTALR
jgi:hypothetical protein